jgi:peptidoglycan/xylan/chitin deacetylase (PgdA/CDA1 family)
MATFEQPDPQVGSFICLMYHNIPQDPASYHNLGASITSYFVEKETFANQLQEVVALGGCYLDSRMVDSFFQQPLQNPGQSATCGHPVLLTFDDGWRDSVETAGPILADQHCQAMIFVTTDFVDRRYFLTRRQLGHLPSQVFRVGSHARSHRMLPQLNDANIRMELADSKAFLEDLLGYRVDSLSVPGGQVDTRVRRIAAEVGYRFLYTSAAHVNRPTADPMAIGRVAIRHNTSMPAFRRYVQQRLLGPQLRSWLLSIPKGLLGPSGYARLRAGYLGEEQAGGISGLRA